VYALIAGGYMNYKNSKWLKKRNVILKRDEYLCRECKRYGRTTEATTVHHVKSASNYPELIYDSKNLISLCNKCHNEMHDRNTDELTAKGIEWVNRIYPPTI